MAEHAPFEMDELKRVAEILMGAAHADGRSQLEEEAVIYQLLAGLLGTNTLPDDMVQQMVGFDPQAFDLERCCAELKLDTPARRKRLLELVAQVTEVDDVHDLDESHYIHRLARCIGATPEEYASLAVEATSGAGDVPPPVPAKR
jgi:uncharacterized tellurite resistance protein B-like protein